MVDAHVHLHSCFCPRAFLDGALANVQRAFHRDHFENGGLACLMMADMAGQNTFESLRGAERAGELYPWQLCDAGDKIALFARHAAGAEILLLSGRQIVSAEKIELLALATNEEFEDGRPLAELISQVLDSGAVAVLPWGFGKWWFQRGRVVKGQLPPSNRFRNRAAPGSRQGALFLGDNSLRPRWSSTPILLRQGEKRGLKILPGSDPLPRASHERNAGRYGFRLEGDFDRGSPAESIKRLLEGQRTQPELFGRRERLWRFFRDQLSVQIHRITS